jgi:hypothetical protein
MEQTEPYVTFADRMDGGVVIEFEDGTTAFFPAKLLHTVLPQAEMMSSDSETGDLAQSG